MATAKKLPSGTWNVTVYDGKSADGKRLYKSFSSPIKEEAEYMASNYKYRQKQLSLPQNMTLKQAYERYIESKSNILSPSTVREYKRSSKHDLQELMSLKLTALTQEKIQRAINVAAMDHAPKSVRNIHGLLSAVLSVYMPSFQLHTRLPQKIKSDIHIPSAEEIKKLLEAAEGTNLHIAILLAAVGTLRRSEICALLDTDVTDSGVHITKALAMDDKNKWVVKGTKTTEGKRFVELPISVVEELKEKKGRIYPSTPGTLSDNFRELTKNVLGKSFRFHDLRHYSASALHALGVPDVYIMRRGGWESRDTLNKVYTHILSKEQESFNQKIMLHFEENILEKKQDAK